MKNLVMASILVWGLGCSSGEPSSQTPQGGPSEAPASSDMPPAPMPSEAPVASAEPPPAASASAAPVDPHELSLERADVKKVVGKMMPDLKKCLKKAEKKDPDLKGQTVLTIAIGPDGKVASVTASDTEGLTKKMVGCLEKAASKQKFEAPPAGGATVKLPIDVEPTK